MNEMSRSNVSLPVATPTPSGSSPSMGTVDAPATPVSSPCASQHLTPPGAPPPPLEVSDTPTASLEADRGRPSLGRYRACEFQGRGGMGEVWLCRDEVIGREVGLKRMIRDDQLSRERFVAEAQITGQLEHPGIVPIHDLGLDEEGKPFYVMKFVRGQTLKAVIDDAHSEGREPKPVERLRMLQVFIDLARAVAYAHSRGVIHRDLKPDNVMIGPYGETVVLDWGLAKLRSGTDLLPAPAVMSPRLSGRGSETQDGGIFGSPLYMSPEMAQGLTAKVDERTDIYLLGATLYEILTGRPPRAGRSRDELLELARTATPVAPRRLSPSVPRALEAICLKALSFRREKRYTSALELAEDVQSFLAGEAVSAMREGIARRVWRWCRQRRRGLLRVAAVMMICAAGAVATVAYRQATLLRAKEQARVAVNEFLARADEARFYAANSDALGERAPYFDRRQGLDAISRATATAAQWKGDLSDFPLTELQPTLRGALYELYLLQARMALHDGAAAGDVDAAASSLDRAEALRSRGTQGFHRLRAELLTRRNDGSGAARERALVDDPAVEMGAEDLFLQAEALRTAGDEAAGSESAKPGERLQKAMALYEAALRLRPDHFWSRFQLARCQLSLGHAPAAVDIFGGCVALRPESAWAHSSLGLALALAGRAADAEGEFARALQIAPDFQPAMLNRGVARLIAGETGKAAADFDRILGLEGDRALPEAAYYRGQIYLNAGDATSALRCFERVAEMRPELAVVQLLVAKAEFLVGDDAAGVARIDRTLRPVTRAKRGAALRRVAVGIPTMAVQQRVAALALKELQDAAAENGATAEVFAGLGAALEAMGQTRRAIDIYGKGIERDPNRLGLYVSRGWARVLCDENEAAGADFDCAIALKPDHAEALAGRGYCLARLGDADAAERDSSAALAAAGGTDYLVLHNVACIYAELSMRSRERANQDLALSLLARAVRLWRAGSGAGPDEIRLIMSERAFPASMKSRPEFAALIDSSKGQRD